MATEKKNAFSAKISRRQVLKGALASAATVSTIAMWPKILRAAEETLQIGVVSPASGNFGDQGASERRGMEMAVREFNAKGGVLGKKVEMLVEDDQTNPMVAARKARALVQRDKVKFMIGGISSATCVAVGQVADLEKVIYVITNGNAEDLTGALCNRYMFRVPFDSISCCAFMAEYVLKEIGKKWYMFTHDYKGGQDSARMVKKLLAKNGGTLLGETMIPMGTSDFSAYLLKVREVKPEVFITNVYGTDFINLMKQAYEFGISKEFPMASPLKDYSDAWALGPNISKGIAPMEWYHYGHPGAKAFVEAYQKNFPAAAVPIPENTCYCGYVGMKALFLAIIKAGTATDTKKVVSAFETLKFLEPANDGEVYVQEWDHQFIQNYYLVQAKEEKNMKDRTDLFEVLKIAKVSDYTLKREESACKLQKL